MQIVIDSVEIRETDRHGHIVAEVEFYDKEQVIQDIGVGDCVSALDHDDILKEIGWDEVRKYFADEIAEVHDEAFEEGKASVEK